ncbi:MAG: ATP-binding protein [Cytophagales bacterium]|nr:ATP-binding protein [Cytophagales bacterium]
MKLKTKYILYISVLHAILLALTIVIYNYNKTFFLVCEAIIFMSFALSIYYYKAFFKSFNLFNAGIDSIADKDFSIKFLPVGQPEFDRLIDVYNRMIDQLRLERTKANEKHFFLEKLIEASPAGVIILDMDNNIRTINRAGLQILGLKNSEDVNTLRGLADPWDTELSGLKENNTSVVQINGINQYKCFRSYFLDRGVKRIFYFIEGLTKELLHAERQAYEKVIRMISHEVNNSVGSANSIMDSSIHYLKSVDHSRMEHYIDALEVAKERISNLNKFTKRFADIVHIPPPEITQCDLKEIVQHVLLGFLGEFRQKSIRVNASCKPSDVYVSFDFQQLELVLANIIKNAIQAIGSIGKINIIIEKFPVSIIIENDGEAIPGDVQRKLFEPFFTTKKTGQGIGLTLIREILINHECEFSLKTREDGMTEFSIVFAGKTR